MGYINVSTNNQYITGRLEWTLTPGSSSTTAAFTLKFSRTNTGYTTTGTGQFTISLTGTGFTANTAASASQIFTFTYNSNTLVASKSVVVAGTGGSISASVSGGLPGTSFDTCSGSTTIPVAAVIVPDPVYAPSRVSRTPADGTLDSTTFTFNIIRDSPTLNHRYYVALDYGGYLVNLNPVGEDPLGDSIQETWTPTNALMTSGYIDYTKEVVEGDFLLETYKDDGTYVGITSAPFTLAVPAAYKPTIAANAIVATVNNGYSGAVVQSKSTLTITVDGLKVSPTYGTPITEYTVDVIQNGNVIATKTDNTTGFSLTTGTFANLGEITFNLTAKDTRGRSTTLANAAAAKSVTAYTAPSVSNFSAFRSNSSGTLLPNGTYLTGTAQGAASHGGSLQFSYKLSTNSTYTNFGTADTTKTLISRTSGSVASAGSQYDVKATMTDYFGTIASQIIRVGIATTSELLHIPSTGDCIGIGQAAVSGQGALQVGGTLKVTGNVTNSGTLASTGVISQNGTAVSLTDHTHSTYSLTSHTHSTYSLTSHTHNIFTLVETKTISVNQALTTSHGTYQYCDFLTFANYTPSANGTVMINLNVNGYYGVVTTSYGFTRAKAYIRNSSTANSSSGIIETYSALLFPTGAGTYEPQILSTGAFFMNVNSGTTYYFKVSSYGDNINGGVATGSKASLYFIPRV